MKQSSPSFTQVRVARRRRIQSAFVTLSIFYLAVIVREQTQIERIRESFVSGIGRVTMVSAIKGRKYPCRLTGITQDAIEIDNGIVFPAAADPRIEGLSLELIRGGPDRERSTG